MEYQTLERCLLDRPETAKEFPFGPETAVFKVAGKVFALVPWQNDPLTINLKCDPDEAIALRDAYDAVQPGYHMNKEHWNTILLNDSLPEGLLLKMIDDSYRLVVAGLRKVDRDKLQTM